MRHFVRHEKIKEVQTQTAKEFETVPE
jgi:hypothetical protein